MSSRKNQQSILVLATLGVYLGLVLVGATPQVLAQAAMTRQFNVKDEVEVKDDLDKKPEPSIDELVSEFDSYFRNVKEFINDLSKLYKIDKFDPNWQTFDSKVTTYHPCPPTGTNTSETSSSYIDRWLLPAIEQAQFATDSGLSDCVANSGPDKRTASGSGIELIYDKSQLTYKASFVKFSNHRADALYDHLSRALEVFEPDEDDATLKAFVRNTSLSKANNKVFIVTRLPRSDLDTLLATDAK